MAKRNPPVVGLGDHDRRIAGEEGAIEHEVHALARRDDGTRAGVVQATDGVAERSRRVDHHPREHLERLSTLQVQGHHTGDEALLVLENPVHLHVVREHSALLYGRRHHVDEQPRVVELTVVIEHAASEPLGLDRGDVLHRLFHREVPRRAEAVTAGQGVVDPHADSVEGRLPPGVVGDDEGKILHQVRGVAAQDAPLLEGFHDQGDVPLPQVAHPSVDELGAAAGGPLAEVTLLEKGHVEAARGGVHRNSDARGPTAHHYHVPGPFAGA